MRVFFNNLNYAALIRPNKVVTRLQTHMGRLHFGAIGCIFETFG